MVTILSKWGNSQAVRIPKEVLEQSKLKEGDRVQIRIENNKIILEPVIKKDEKISLRELFKNYNGDPVKELDWGEAQGEEIW